ncbi:MAG: hypothetical protein WA874_19090 [Chryseosolibacter sp.]
MVLIRIERFREAFGFVWSRHNVRTCRAFQIELFYPSFRVEGFGSIVALLTKEDFHFRSVPKAMRKLSLFPDA